MSFMALEKIPQILSSRWPNVFNIKILFNYQQNSDTYKFKFCKFLLQDCQFGLIFCYRVANLA